MRRFLQLLSNEMKTKPLGVDTERILCGLGKVLMFRTSEKRQQCFQFIDIDPPLSPGNTLARFESSSN